MNMIQKFNAFTWNAKHRVEESVKKAGAFVSKKARGVVTEENGDTNFISIIIILAIVLVVAGIFILFKDQIIGWFNTTTTDFFSTVDGQQDYTTSH